LGLMWFYRYLGIAGWLANPAIGLSWFYYLRGSIHASLISAGIALVLMLSFLRVEGVPFGLKQDVVPILSHGEGYWLWVASAAIMVVVAGSHWLATVFRKGLVRSGS